MTTSRASLGRFGGRIGAIALTLVLSAGTGGALDEVSFDVAEGTDDDLVQTLRDASAIRAAEAEGTTEAQDIFAAARAEYGRLLGALYASGHYSGVISVRIDGREAADIAPLNAPAAISRVEVRVDPGPAFTFGAARIAPVAPGTDLPGGYRAGDPALSGKVTAAAQAGVDGWRAVGHAKAAVTSQDIVADHARRTLAADLGLNPGPRLRFGPLTVVGHERMRLRRIVKIAGLPQGRVFDPRELDRVATRLRRTGVFRSVTLTEDDRITPPDLLGITATVVEEKLRRYTFGGELSSLDGVTLRAAWLHRNLLGGGERLRISGEIAQIGAQTSGADYALGVTLDRPATLGPDVAATARLDIAHLAEEDYTSDKASAGIGFTWYRSERLTARIGLQYTFEDVEDASGDYRFRNLSLPLGVLWDDRDKPLDARRGTYLDAEVKPFLGFGTTGSGLRVRADGRAYRSLGERDRVTFAGRLQVGAVLGPDLLETPRADLFYSGGGGSVRGQPYQSLGVQLTDDLKIGGQAFLAASVEARVRVSRRIGVVGFIDWGHVGALDFFDDAGDSHAGAGLGLRYDTGFGPIRLDVAAPVSGDTGKGAQVYIGIGQAF
ncbi:MAG: autotransporter assembly complex protein TamA [Gemmobacter sp.]